MPTAVGAWQDGVDACRHAHQESMGDGPWLRPGPPVALPEQSSASVLHARALPVGLYGTEYRMKLNDVNVATQPAKPELPAQAISEEVLLEKYAKGGERTIDDVRRRVAHALAAVELPEQHAGLEESFY